MEDFSKVWKFWWGLNWRGDFPPGRLVEKLMSPFKHTCWPNDKLIVFPHYIKMKVVAKQHFDAGIRNECITTCQFPDCPKAEKCFGNLFYQAGIDFANLDRAIDYHTHVCKNCFCLWSHGNNVRQKNSKIIKKAHICPRCEATEQNSVLDECYQGWPW